jgi:hypothetical protein
VAIDGAGRTKICRQVFWLTGWGSKKIYQGLMSTLGDNAYGLSQIKIWLQRFRTGDLSCSDLPRVGGPPLTLVPQVEASLQKCSFPSARIIAKHFLTTASTVKEILPRELGMRKLSWRWVSHYLSDAQKVPPVEAAKEMLRILQESETNDFDGIATGDESWFQRTRASSKTIACLAVNVIPRTGQAVGAKTMITVFFTAEKLIVFDVLPRGSTFSQLYFINNIFPDSKTTNLKFRRQKT